MSLLHEEFKFDNSYANQLSGLYVPWHGTKAPAPKIIKVNEALAIELGLTPALLNTTEGAEFFAGSQLPESATPIAQAYAGHQFGGFAAQLGDGRALLLGEIFDTQGNRRDIQLKGSGWTPFSRGGDGKAPLGPVLREYLFGEAMHTLGIPTSRSLAAVTTGEQVRRKGLEPGAVLARVASSHIRIGTFQFFAARKDREKVQQLADYTIHRHFPDLENSEAKYLDLLVAVMKNQAKLVAKWMAVGFVHGVMNTDNTTISGETIDYGPCAFMDHYDPGTVFSSIDVQGRYAYGNQPAIALWNLSRFAETLLTLIDPEDFDRFSRLAVNQLNTFAQLYEDHWLNEMRAKLGLQDKFPDDMDLLFKLQKSMENQNVDFTGFFRQLATAARGDTAPVRGLFDNAGIFDTWLPLWFARLDENKHSRAVSADRMDQVNPIYIPRNHLVEAALDAAVKEGDMKPFDELHQILSKPFDAQQGKEHFSKPAPKDAEPHKTFCGT